MVWLTGMRLPKEVSLGQFTLALVGLQVILAGLVWMALAPYAAEASGVVASSAVLEQIPSVMGEGLSPALLFVALGVAAVFALAFAAEPLLTRLSTHSGDPHYPTCPDTTEIPRLSDRFQPGQPVTEPALLPGGAPPP